MLRSIQKQKIKKMLEIEDAPFKTLILDDETQDILSSLFKVSDLRDSGVTSHFLLSSYRTPIKDIPAIYFVSSTKEICQDLLKDLYSSYYLNSSTSFKRSDLENIAVKLSERQMALKVKSVYDRFIEFISLQEDLFTFNIENSYIMKDDPENMRKITLSLFSLFITLNELPFIVSKTSDIGKMLFQKIRNTKIIKQGVKKPLLIIIDRDFDILSPTHHNLGYVELIHDLFGIKNNKVEIGKESVNLDTDSDFYKENCLEDFPTVTERVEKELLAYKKEMALRSITDKSDKKAIQDALNTAPHLQKRNEIINTNLSICIKIVEEVKNRKIDDFYKMEREFDKNEIMELSEKGNQNDILRLCLSMINSKNSDLIDPILEKRKINKSLIEKFRSLVKVEGGLRDRFKKLIFKKTLPICSYVEEVMGQIQSQSLPGAESYDPSGNGLFLSEISRVIVFVNGGFTYSELKGLKELEKAYKIPFIGGGSEILSADVFLSQIQELLK